MRLAVLLLAAGASRRFGGDDKLLAPLNGHPLVSHAARALRGVGAVRHLAVVSAPAVGMVVRDEGFGTLTIAPGQGQSASLAAGVRDLARDDPDAILIVLGDMPFLRAADFKAVVAAGRQGLACAAKDRVPMPPALFQRDWFSRLMAMTGDRGGRDLLAAIPAAGRVDIAPDRLRDIDVPGDLAAG